MAGTRTRPAAADRVKTGPIVKSLEELQERIESERRRAECPCARALAEILADGLRRTLKAADPDQADTPEGR